MRKQQQQTEKEYYIKKMQLEYVKNLQEGFIKQMQERQEQEQMRTFRQMMNQGDTQDKLTSSPEGATWHPDYKYRYIDT